MATTLATYDAGLEYPNLTEANGGADRFFPDETLARLRAVKADVDPEGVFQANHEID